MRRKITFNTPQMMWAYITMTLRRHVVLSHLGRFESVDIAAQRGGK